MYTHALSTSVHPYSMQPTPTQTKTTCLPTRVLDVDHVRRSLGLNQLSSQGMLNYILSTAGEALTYGQPECISFNGHSYVRVVHQQMLFTLSYDCTTVISIQWVLPRPVQDQTMTTAAKAIAIPRAVSTESPSSPSSPSMSSVLSLNGRAVSEDSAEYDLIVDQIVDDVDRFVLDDATRHYTRSTTPSASTSISCIPPSPTPSQSSTSTKCLPKMSGLAPPPPLTCIPSIEEINDCSLSLQKNVHVIVSDALYQDVSIRFAGICNWESKAHFAQMVHSIISRRPGRYDQHVMSWRIWSCSPFVVVTESDGCTLADVFEERYFSSHYQHCMQSLARRYAPKPVGHSVSGSTSRSTLMSTQSPSVNISKSSKCTPQSIRYHLIYIKPIMERLSKVLGRSDITESMVIQIVDGAIRCGAKRQISKRTFAFQWQGYTVIMSKSLKTILDVAVNGNGEEEVVTVHPDVVSILAKKCPNLDYFTIQNMAGCAKRTGRFTVKKNEYRKQYRYEFAGCHIVFASNHSTIVEMQCVDRCALSMWSIAK